MIRPRRSSGVRPRANVREERIEHGLDVRDGGRRDRFREDAQAGAAGDVDRVDRYAQPLLYLAAEVAAVDQLNGGVMELAGGSQDFAHGLELRRVARRPVALRPAVPAIEVAEKHG